MMETPKTGILMLKILHYHHRNKLYISIALVSIRDLKKKDLKKKKTFQTFDMYCIYFKNI